MNEMKKIFACLLMVLLLCGCTKAPQQTQPTQPPNKTVGVCLPDFDWNEQAQELTRLLEEKGYQVFVEYAGGDLHRQRTQLETFVNMPVNCAVVVAMDALTLLDTLEDAGQENVPVIALDRMLTYTDAVTGCVASDSYGAGQQLGRYIAKTKQLDTAETQVSIEFYMDAPENHSSVLFYQGVMEALQPYLTDGVLYCPTGRVSFEDVCVPEGSGDYALDRLFDQLAETEKAPDVICAASDELAAGCINAMVSYGMDPEENWPLVTGFGATQDALEYIEMGYQNMTLYVDTDALLQQCVQWVDQVVMGETLTGTMLDNGMMQVPCALQTPTLIDASNYKDYISQ